MDQVETIKAELARFSEEEVRAKEKLIAVESSLEEYKVAVSDLKAITKKADDLVIVVIEAVLNTDQTIDEETMKLIEETIRDLTEALKRCSISRKRADGGNSGGPEDSSGDHNLNIN